MRFATLKEHWNRFGEEDPLWGILTWPDKKGGRWEPEEFFQTGTGTVDRLMESVGKVKPDLSMQRALDFGCGVGRLTQALAPRFESVVGVDIAPSMIATAKAFNQFGSKCRYQVNDRPNLKCFGDDEFDFVLTLIVLQDMRPHYAKGYLREFVRILRPGGLLAFQLPSVSLTPDGAQLDTSWNEPVAELYGIPRDEVIEFAGEIGSYVLYVSEAANGGAEKSYTYFLEKSKFGPA